MDFSIIVKVDKKKLCLPAYCVPFKNENRTCQTCIYKLQGCRDVERHEDRSDFENMGSIHNKILAAHLLAFVRV